VPAGWNAGALKVPRLLNTGASELKEVTVGAPGTGKRGVGLVKEMGGAAPAPGVRTAARVKRAMQRKMTTTMTPSCGERKRERTDPVDQNPWP
jgi:hypothetical protein